MINKVRDLRKMLAHRQTVCASTPGWYRWWCDKEAANVILSQVGVSKVNVPLLRREIDGREYVAIYFGISNDLNGRIKWHVCQNHTAGAVRSGFLSTLRQSLSALLGSDMTKSQQPVNEFMDAHCYLEYENLLTYNEAKDKEKQELSHTGYFYPLNISGAKSTPKQIKNRLITLRKLHKR